MSPPDTPVTPAKDSPPRGLLLDLDGVLYVGDRPLPGAREAVLLLRRRGIPFRFLTNTSTKLPSAVERKLDRLGFTVQSGEVISAVQTAVELLARWGVGSPYLVVDHAVASLFDRFPGAVFFPQRPTRPPDAVVIGDIGEQWDYRLMDDLFAMVRDGARLVALHRGRAWQTQQGLRIDIGAFVAGLEYAAGCEAVVTGKPAPELFQAAVRELGVQAGEVIMVGDDLDSDVGGAQACGIRGVLVRTGKYREEQLAESAVVPWRVIDSVAELETLLTSPRR